MATVKLYIQDGDEHREYTDAEYAQDAADKIANDALVAAQAAKATAKTAVLNKLGLTADEVAALLS